MSRRLLRERVLMSFRSKGLDGQKTKDKFRFASWPFVQPSSRIATVWEPETH
jgi:hypothetical protein